MSTIVHGRRTRSTLAVHAWLYLQRFLAPGNGSTRELHVAWRLLPCQSMIDLEWTLLFQCCQAHIRNLLLPAGSGWMNRCQERVSNMSCRSRN